jgi:hypothetical protein
MGGNVGSWNIIFHWFFLFSLMKPFITQMHDLVDAVLELILMFPILVYTQFGSFTVTYI